LQENDQKERKKRRTTSGGVSLLLSGFSTPMNPVDKPFPFYPPK